MSHAVAGVDESGCIDDGGLPHFIQTCIRSCVGSACVAHVIIESAARDTLRYVHVSCPVPGQASVAGRCLPDIYMASAVAVEGMQQKPISG